MSELRYLSDNSSNTRRNLLITITMFLGIIAGLSIYEIPSPYSPLIVFAGFVSVLSLIICLGKPILAMYFAIFVVFLPVNLIPPEINSYINRIATILAFALWVIELLKHRGKIIIPLSTYLMIGFIAWSTITLIWAEFFSDGMETLQRFVLRLVLFMIVCVNQIRTRKNLDGLMNTLALNGGLLVIVSLITLLFQGYTPGSRLEVLMVNENELGIVLLIFMPAVFWWANNPLMKENLVKKMLGLFYILSAIGLIGLSGSRGSALSLGFTLMLFLLWKPTRFWGISGFLFIGLIFLLLPDIFSTTVARFNGLPGDTILGGREFLWPASLQMIKDHFFTGVGIGNSSYQIHQYLLRISPPWYLATNTSLHNPILVVWADTGLIGLVLYIGVLIFAFLSILRQYYLSIKQNLNYKTYYSTLVITVFLGYLVSWIKGGGMESDFSYFLMIAMLLIPSHLDKKNIIYGNL